LFIEKEKPMQRKKNGDSGSQDADALFQPENLKDFIRFFEKMDVAEVEITVKDKSLSLSKKSRHSAAAAPAAFPAAEMAVASSESSRAAADKRSSEKPARAQNTVEITAPIVGTFYRSPEPGKPPFVKIGDVIEPGKVICLIEAMKVFNEIKAEVRGVVKEVCLENEQAVEFGQAIFILETK
jgi:acetyl-CoA carboxylase biotin carboxyl carrier protein